MRRKTVMARLRKLGLAFLACLVFAVLAPMYFAERRTDESFTISSVSASPRDLLALTQPVRLSDAPDLALTRAIVYDYGPAAGGSKSHILLEGPVFALNAAGLPAAERAGKDDAGGAELGPLSPLVQQIVALGFAQITIRRGTLNVTMADGTVETVGDIHAEVSQRKDRIESQGSFTVRGQRLAFVAAVGPPPDKKSPLRRPLQASIKGTLIQGSFTGHLDLAEDLQLTGETELSTPSLRRVGRWFGLPLQGTEGFKATTIKAELTWARRSLAFEKADLVVDGNRANGRLVLNLGGERPLVDATLDFSQLDLTPYAEAARLQFFGFDLPGASWPSFDISLPMIRHLDADLRISAHKVALKGYTFGQGAATIAAHGGKLQADITELEFSSGTLSAQVTAIMSEVVPRYALRAKIENIEAGPASALFLGGAALAGRATIALDLTSAGYTLHEIVGRLSGKTSLAMPKGGRLALDVKALREAAKAGTRGWGKLAKSPTSVELMEARALIIGGVAFAEAVQARSGSLALAAWGRVGLEDGNMDLRLSLKPDVPADQPFKLTDMTGGETVTLRGPWYDPIVRREEADIGTLPR
jgi:AsmA protein